MLNILGFLLNLIEQYTAWIYIASLVVILFYLRAFLVARSERRNTIFTIEREVAAHREGRAMSSIGAMLGVMVVVTAVKFYLMPMFDIQALVQAPTPTVTVMLLAPSWTPTPTVEPTAAPPTATPRPRATVPPAEPTPTATITLPPMAPCPDPNVRITSPRMSAAVSGRVTLQGTAQNARFQFYKVELGVGEQPTAWHSISDIVKTPAQNKTLATFDTTQVPNGVYWLRLTVVDITGNFPQPCDVRILVRN